MTRAPVALVDLSEAEFTLQLIGTKTNPGLARMVGWRCYHTLRSKGSEAGYPDWTLVRERVMFVETKASKTPVSPAQKEWIRALLVAGAEAYLVRPEHLQDMATVLGYRGVFPQALLAHTRLWDYTQEAIA